MTAWVNGDDRAPRPRTHEVEPVADHARRRELAIQRSDGHAVHQRHARVLLQVGTDLGAVDDDIDPEPGERVGRADAGHHQQLRRYERAGREDDLSGAGRSVCRAAVAVLDADGAPVVHQNPGRDGVTPKGQVRPSRRRSEIRPCRAVAPAAPLGRLADRHPFLREAVVVGVQSVAGLLGRPDEHLGDRLGSAWAGPRVAVRSTRGAATGRRRTSRRVRRSVARRTSPSPRIRPPPSRRSRRGGRAPTPSR